jgi:hypothetical protein
MTIDSLSIISDRLAYTLDINRINKTLISSYYGYDDYATRTDQYFIDLST